MVIPIINNETLQIWTIYTWFLIGALVIFASFFFYKVRRKGSEPTEQIIFMGHGLFFLFYSITRLFFYFADLERYITKNDQSPSYSIYSGLAYLVGLLAIISVLYAHERTFLHTKYIFTMIGIALLIPVILTVFLISPLSFTRLIIYSYLTIFGIVIFVVYINVALKTPKELTFLGGIQSPGEMRSRAILIIIGFFIFFSGTIIDSTVGAAVFASFGLSFGVVISIAPFIMIVGGAIFTFSQREVLAKKAEVKGIFVISKEGICMVEQKFKDILVDSHLITGVITAISSIIKESVQTKKKLKSIDHEDVKILIEWGTYVNSAVITDIETSDLRKNLKNFLKSFEIRYSQHIEEWTGDIDLISGADNLIEQYFKDYIS